ncbi:MAG: redox-regulated ATPase YchF [Bdellovibrionales bacterium]|nr:redox-regulated ATPase YchF [Bdellovibrionales bacterium]
MKCGIIGLPNVGKSTLFNCLTSLRVSAENYPFCTVNPNIGRVNVPDLRLTKLARIFEPEKVTPTSIEFVDIAGLLPGAHKGEGLGNRFLSHIREVDALIHVVRVFRDKNISHVQGDVDPIRDIQLIETELLLADVESLENKKEKLIKLSKGSKEKELKIELSLTEKLLRLLLDEETPALQYKPEKEEKIHFRNLRLLTSKPCLYICNVDESFNEIDDSQSLIKGIKDKYGSNVVLSICASLEAQIAELDSEEEKQEFLTTLNLAESGLSRLIKCSYRRLNLITFFTAGKKEVRAWTVSKGSSAPIAAGKIHSDFQKGFIQAEVYSFADMQTALSEKVLKESGKYRQEGKEYIVQDGDIMLFRFSL